MEITTSELIRGWLRDPKLVPEMLHMATQNKTNTAGVINTLIILKNIDPVLFLSSQVEIAAFLDSLKSSDASVLQHAQDVRSRI